MLLLDTHTWIWAVAGDARRLGRRARGLLARAESQGAIRIATATIFEVAALHTAGRLRLARPLEEWIDNALAGTTIRLAPLSASIAVDAGSIPRAALADPLDRVLVATARQLDATFLTNDQAILGYASSTRNVRAQDAGV